MADAETRFLKLAAEFPPATQAQWRALVDAALKGRPFERLASRSYDGIAIAPLYAPADAPGIVQGRAPGNAWRLMQRIDHPDPAAANAQALHDLVNGATGLSLVVAGSVGAGGFGLPATAAAVSAALCEVRADAATIDLDLGWGVPDLPRAVADTVRREGADPSAADLRFGLDPFGAPLQRGALPDWPEAAKLLAETARELSGQGFCGPFAVADGRVVHAAGGSEAQELAYVLAAAVAYLRAFETGSGLDAARRHIYFRLAADADQFLTTAKFRALRKLWARIEESCGLAPTPTIIAAETAWRMLSRRDPYVNLLRGTLAVFAAAVGGADSITALPFTAAIGLPDGFARRLARNTQLILAEESQLARVADPAAGSGAIEALTADLCAAAWALFQETEEAGGLAAALSAGLLQEKVAATRAAREKAVATRRDPLTGVSEFPHLREAEVAVLMPAGDQAAPAAVAAAERSVTALAPMRLAAPFEALRDASDAMLAATGARPTVFLANLGRPSDFLARATFAKNFFEAGGIAATGDEGFAVAGEDGGAADLAPLAAACAESGARLACLCSSDAIYADHAEAAATALAGTGAHVYLAGRLPEQEAALRAAGVSDFIHVGCDLLAMLRQAHALARGEPPAATPA